jgi:hypothetical protein
MGSENLSEFMQQWHRYIAEVQNDVLEFELFWLDMNKQSPDAFPLSLSEAEWEVELDTWMETK